MPPVFIDHFLILLTIAYFFAEVTHIEMKFGIKIHLNNILLSSLILDKKEHFIDSYVHRIFKRIQLFAVSIQYVCSYLEAVLEVISDLF